MWRDSAATDTTETSSDYRESSRWTLARAVASQCSRGVRRVEQVGLGEQVAEDGGPALAEGGVGDVGVLAADGRDVLGVAAVGRREDREVGVGEHAAGDVAVGAAGGSR